MAALLGLILCLVQIIFLSHSQTIINTLPGFPGQLPFKLETGYIGVGEAENLQLFYYFVESQRNAEDDPLLLRLAGGPGCSDVTGFFYGVGPLAFDYTKSADDDPNMEFNPFAWTEVANILFYDPPLVGYSYAKKPECYKNSDTLSAEYAHEFLRKWLRSHPKFRNHPVYVAGLSYAGIIVPILVQDILKGNEAGTRPSIHIKGYILGNPLTDRSIDSNSRIPYAHQRSLISDEIFKSATTTCNGDFINGNSSNLLCGKILEEVDKCLKDIYIYNILEPVCSTDVLNLLLISDGSLEKNNGIHNPILFPTIPEQWCRNKTFLYVDTWANRKDVQNALNIREETIPGKWVRCNDDHYWYGKEDIPTYSYNIPSSLPYHKYLIQKGIRALIYSGDHDLTFPHIGTRKGIQSLNLSINSTWTPWYVKNQVAGYTETYLDGDNSLTFATVKGAGHDVCDSKPEICQSMIDHWLNYNSL